LRKCDLADLADPESKEYRKERRFSKELCKEKKKQFLNDQLLKVVNNLNKRKSVAAFQKIKFIKE